VHWSQAIRLRQPVTDVFKLLVVDPTIWLVITLPWINGSPPHRGAGFHFHWRKPGCLSLLLRAAAASE
jgi:hypothetical protein